MGPMVIRLRCRGPFACYTALGLRAERATLTLGSHEGWRGFLRRILSKFACTYIIHKVSLLSMPRRIAITGNEFKFNSVSFQRILASNGQHTQRTTVYIKDPDYLLEFSIELTGKSSRPQDTLDKYYAMFRKRARRGQYEIPPVFGTSECRASYDLVEDKDLTSIPRPVDWSEDLGITFFGSDWQQKKNYFYPLAITRGVLEYPSWTDVKRLGITKPIGRDA